MAVCDQWDIGMLQHVFEKWSRSCSSLPLIISSFDLIFFLFCFPWKSDMPSYEERSTWSFDFVAARPMKYPNLQERPNECDELDGEEEHRVTINCYHQSLILTAKVFLKSIVTMTGLELQRCSGIWPEIWRGDFDVLESEPSQFSILRF